MGAIAQFNYATWAALFTQFSTTVNEAQADLYAELATSLYLRNDGGNVIQDPSQQANLLNLLVAHIAQLFSGTNQSQGPSGLVGRISSASEGSVSVGTEYQIPESPTAAWYNQTPFGAAYWAAAAVTRNMRYVPGPTRNFNPWFGIGFTRPGRF